MVSFKRKKVEDNKKTLAEILVERRKELEISLIKAERRTKIQKKYLDALESGDYSVFPGQVYGRNFLRAYATYLDLDIARLVSLFDKEYNLYNKFKGNVNSSNIEFKPRSKASHFIIFPKVARNIIIVAIIAILLGYLGFKVKNIVTPPFLEIRQPVDNLIVRDYQVEVVGTTEKEAILSINNNEVLPQDSGEFIKKVNLKEGLNIIEIKASKKHSRENIIKRHILVVQNGEKDHVTSN